ncbi:MAG: 3-oxoacyl-acyl-carrier protein reductase [bacterium]|nr:MAG: 3-oxoacyl-acyl-carrier protein reductase [bacterium]
MDLGLKDRVAIVTGASQGIGRAIACGLAAEGASLVICARNTEVLEKTASQIKEKYGVNVVALTADVTKLQDIERLVNQAIATFCRIDILVNNSGGPHATKFQSTPPEAWQPGIDLILMSVVHACRSVIPHMQARKWGRIINITSISVKQPINDLILSNTLRAGVIGLAKSLANELGKDNILVNNICPGYTLTDRLQELINIRAKAAQITQEQIVKQWENDVPIGRLAKPEEIADYAVFLASERASYINGTTVAVDGGLVKGIM